MKRVPAVLSALVVFLSCAPLTAQVTMVPPTTSSLADGTAAAPSIAFASDPGSGFYRLAASTIAWSVAGTPYISLADNFIVRSSSQIAWSSGAIGAAQDVVLIRDAANTLALKNATAAQKLTLYQTTTGPVANSLVMTAPTIQGGTFGTSPVVVAGSTAFSMRINVGTGGVATSGVIVVPAAPNGWNCPVVDMTTNVVTRETASTTTTITVTAASAWAASDILMIGPCVQY